MKRAVTIILLFLLASGCVSTHSRVKWGDFEHELHRNALGQGANMGLLYTKPTTGTLKIQFNLESTPEPGVTMIDNATGKIMSLPMRGL